MNADEKTEDDDELRPEYDLSKMKLVGRGIYAERYRSGTKFFLLDDEQAVKEHGPKRRHRLGDRKVKSAYQHQSANRLPNRAHP